MANKFVLTAQVALQAPTNTRQVLNQIRSQIGKISVDLSVNANASQLGAVSNQLNTVNKNAKAANASVSELGKTIGIAARRFGAISLATGTFLSLTRAIKGSIGDAIEFERQMIVLAQTTEKSTKDLGDLYKEINRLSTGLGVSSDGLLKTSIILAQAGLEARKAKAALEVLAKTQLAASFDDIGSTTEGAIAILAQFRKEAVGAGGDIAFLEKSLEAINQVSKKYAVESSDLIAVIRRSGGAFEAAGGSLNELLALFTSVRATTRESAETIATGLRTIFTRIQRVDTIRQLQELGIVLQDIEGKFVGPYEAIKRISEGLSSLDPRDFKFAQIVEELGGFRQIGKVIPLIKQFALAQDALNTAQQSSGSLSQDAATAQLSLANKISKVKEEFQSLVREFVDSEGFRSVANGALEFARALVRIADAIQPLLPLIASLGAIQVGRGLASALGSFSGFSRKNNGGRILAFATGGTVPGTGNRDTVPAMLTPGEFVIRKSSVNKIGASNLQKLNKGGSVKNLASTGIANESSVGGLFLDPHKPNLETRVLSGPTNSKGQKYTLQSSGIDTTKTEANLSQKLRDSIEVSLATSINESINSILSVLGVSAEKVIIPEQEKRKFTENINPGAIGTVFEAVLTRVARQTTDEKFDQRDPNAPFDFVSSSGMGSAIKNLFPYHPASSEKYIDAKASYDTGRPKDFASKIERQIEQDYKSENLPAQKAKLKEVLKSASPGTASDILTAIKLSGLAKPKNLQDFLEENGFQEGADYTATQKVDDKGDILRDQYNWKFFAQGGSVKSANRNIGYIDSDVLNDPKNKDVVQAEIAKLAEKGVAIKDGYRGYKKYLEKLAVDARKSGSVQKLSNIVGLPGSGKSTLMLGNEKSDNAALRKTNRFPILTPEDVARSSGIINVTASLNEDYIKDIISGGDRTVVLSSSTKQEQDLLRKRRKNRDSQINAGVSATGFGRRAGTTKSAPVDSGYMEALLQSSMQDSSKIATLGITDKGFRKKAKQEIPKVQEELINLFYGNFGPATAGHKLGQEQGMMASPGARSIVAVGIDTPVKAGDPHSQRTAILPQKDRVEMAKRVFKDSTVVKATADQFGFGLPSLYDVGADASGRRQFVKPAAGSFATVGDEKGDQSLSKYEKAGLKPVSLPRIEGISGTGLREAILMGDMEAIKAQTTKEGFDYLQGIIPKIQNRAAVLPEILKRVSAKSDKKLDPILSELEKYPARLSKTTPEDIKERVAQLRDERDKIKSSSEKRPLAIMKKLSSIFPEKYATGGNVASSDTVPAMLTPGEFVVNKEAAKRIGYGKLNKINKTGDVQGYAKGGPVAVKGFAAGGTVDTQSFTRGTGAWVNSLDEAKKIRDIFADSLGNLKKDFKDIFEEPVGDMNDLVAVFDKVIKSLDPKDPQLAATKAKRDFYDRGKASGAALRTGGTYFDVNGLQTPSEQIVRHEFGHRLDNAVAKKGGYGSTELASEVSGSFQNDIAKKLRPLLEKQLRDAKLEESYIQYRLKSSEIFADLIANTTPEARKVLLSTMDSAKGMAKLAKVVDSAGGHLKGLSTLTSSDLLAISNSQNPQSKQTPTQPPTQTPVPPSPPRVYQIGNIGSQKKVTQTPTPPSNQYSAFAPYIGQQPKSATGGDDEDSKGGIREIAASLQSFIFLAGSASTLATQFSSMSDAQKQAITETTALGATLAGVAGTVVSFGASLVQVIAQTGAGKAIGGAVSGAAGSIGKSIVGLLGTTLATVGGVLVGAIGLAVAGFAAYYVYQKNLNKALSEEAKKRAGTIAEEIEQGKRSIAAKDKFIEEETNAARLGVSAYYFSVTSIQEEVAQRKRSAEAFINTIVAIRNFDDQLKAIDADKSLKPLEASLKRLSARINLSSEVRTESGNASSQIREIINSIPSAGGSIEKARSALAKNPERLKTFEQAEAASKKQQETLRAENANIMAGLQSSLEESLRLTQFSAAGDAVKEFADQNSLYSAQFAASRQAIENNAQQMATSILSTTGSITEAAKVLSDADAYIAAYEESQKKQVSAAKLAQQNALLLNQAMQKSAQSSFISVKVSEYLTEVGQRAGGLSQTLDKTTNIINREFSSFSLPEIQGLDDFTKIADLQTFKQQIDTVASNFGQFGNAAAEQIKAVAEVFKNSKGLLGREFIAITKDGQSYAGSEANDAIDSLLAPLKGLGGAVEPLVQRARAGLLEAASAQSEDGSSITQAELENSLGALKNFTQQYASLFAELNARQADLVNQYSNYSKALAESFQKDIDLKESAVSVQSRFAERMAQATGKPMTLAQKDSFRAQATQTRLQAVGVSSAGGIGGLGQQLRDFQNRLRENNKQLQQATKNQDYVEVQKLTSEERALTLQSRETAKALEGFADQTEKASDVLSEIEKERGKRDLGMKTISDLVVGSQEERGGILKSFAGLQMASQTGTLQGFDAETRKSVFGLLDQLGSVDQRFEEFKKNLVISDAVSMGLDPQIAQTLATATPKEQQLQQQLTTIMEQEAFATEMLRLANLDNTNSLLDLTKEVSLLTISLKEESNKRIELATREFALREQENAVKQAELKAKDMEAKKQAEADASNKKEADAKAKENSLQTRTEQVEKQKVQMTTEDVANRAKAEEKIKGQKEQQEEFNRKQNQAARITAGYGIGYRASGGPVYAKTGAYIMSPKGTDTVPAMLTPGEFVLNKDSVNKYGVDMISSMNEGTYMAGGGAIKRSILDAEPEARVALKKRGVADNNAVSDTRKFFEQRNLMDNFMSAVDPENSRLKKLNEEIAAIKQKNAAMEAAFQENENDKVFESYSRAMATSQAAPAISRPSQLTVGNRPTDLGARVGYGQSRREQTRQNQLRLQYSSTQGYGGPVNNVLGSLLGGGAQQQVSPEQSRANRYNAMRASNGLPVNQQGSRFNINSVGAGQPQNVYNQAGVNRNQSAPGVNLDGAMSGFKDFSDKITNAANLLSGMTMNHTVTVDGMLQVNSAEVAEAVKQSVAQFVVQEVTKQLGSNSRFNASGSTVGRK